MSDEKTMPCPKCGKQLSDEHNEGTRTCECGAALVVCIPIFAGVGPPWFWRDKTND
jgi:hypothetical protein